MQWIEQLSAAGWPRGRASGQGSGVGKSVAPPPVTWAQESRDHSQFLSGNAPAPEVAASFKRLCARRETVAPAAPKAVNTRGAKFCSPAIVGCEDLDFESNFERKHG